MQAVQWWNLSYIAFICLKDYSVRCLINHHQVISLTLFCLKWHFSLSSVNFMWGMCWIKFLNLIGWHRVRWLLCFHVRVLWPILKICLNVKKINGNFILTNIVLCMLIILCEHLKKQFVCIFFSRLILFHSKLIILSLQISYFERVV